RGLVGPNTLDDEVEPVFCGETGLVAVVSDLDAPHELHDEVRAAIVRGAAIEHLGDVGMIHHCQRLTFRLESRDDLLGVHPQLDNLERYTSAHRLGLFGHLPPTTPTFTALLPN